MYKFLTGQDYLTARGGQAEKAQRADSRKLPVLITHWAVQRLTRAIFLKPPRNFLSNVAGHMELLLSTAHRSPAELCLSNQGSRLVLCGSPPPASQ